MTIPIAILAGGLGTRLNSIVPETVPKALVPVANRPFLAYQLQLLKAQNVRKVVLCVGHLGEMIEKYFGDGSELGMELVYSFDGPKLLGTAGALAKALPFLGEHFFVIYGDSYLAIDFAGVAEAYFKSGKPGLMTVYQNEGRWDTSNVWFEDGEMRVYSKRNRLPEMRYIDYGLSVFSAEVFRELPTDEATDLSIVMERLVAEKQLVGYPVAQRFYEVGSVSGVKEFEELVLSERIEFLAVE